MGFTVARNRERRPGACSSAGVSPAQYGAGEPLSDRVTAGWLVHSAGGTMWAMQTVVLGAGPAGCVAALALARRSHDVALIDRDESPELFNASADQIFDTWDRPAIGQFRQPHNLLGRGRAIRAPAPGI